MCFMGAQTFRSGLLRIGYEAYQYETFRCITYQSETYRLLNITAFKHFADLKVHKNENFFGFDLEFCTISMLVMHK